MALAAELEEAGIEKKLAEAFTKATATVDLFLATFRCDLVAVDNTVALNSGAHAGQRALSSASSKLI